MRLGPTFLVNLWAHIVKQIGRNYTLYPKCFSYTFKLIFVNSISGSYVYNDFASIDFLKKCATFVRGIQW